MEFQKWIQGKGKVLIVMHDNPDPDCLASAMALRHLLIMRCNRQATIAFSGIIARAENLVMATELEVFLTPLDILDIHDFQVICMVDTQPGTGNNSLPNHIPVDIVIDHHPLRPSTKACRFYDVREEYGTTATILYEYLVREQITFSTKMATALFYAIKSETQDLGREASDPDRDAYMKLFPLTNKRLLSAITHPKLPREYFAVLKRTLDNTQIIGPLLIARLGDVNFPEIVAEMAELMLRHDGIQTVLAMARYGDDLIFSLRTASNTLNAGELVKIMAGELGKAGGHGMMAGGKIGPLRREAGNFDHVEALLVQRLVVNCLQPPLSPTPPKEASV